MVLVGGGSNPPPSLRSLSNPPRLLPSPAAGGQHYIATTAAGDADNGRRLPRPTPIAAPPVRAALKPFARSSPSRAAPIFCDSTDEVLRFC
jgi:hypothetical protein